MADIELQDQEVRRVLAELQDRIGNIDAVLMDIGEALTESSKRRFGSLTGPDGTFWTPNSDITRERKGLSKPPLTDGGFLGQQIEPQSLGAYIMAVVANMEYAATQQFGAAQGEFGRDRRNHPIPWGDIPPRPFLGMSADDKEEILDIVSEALREAMD